MTNNTTSDELAARLLKEFRTDPDVVSIMSQAMREHCSDVRTLSNSPGSTRSASSIMNAVLEKITDLPADDQRRIARLRNDIKAAGVSEMEVATKAINAIAQKPNNYPSLNQAGKYCWGLGS